MLKVKTSLLELARKNYFLKFRHIEVAIGGNFHSKFFERMYVYKLTNGSYDWMYLFRINVDGNFNLALVTSVLK